MTYAVILLDSGGVTLEGILLFSLPGFSAREPVDLRVSLLVRISAVSRIFQSLSKGYSISMDSCIFPIFPKAKSCVLPFRERNHDCVPELFPFLHMHGAQGQRDIVHGFYDLLYR